MSIVRGRPSPGKWLPARKTGTGDADPGARIPYSILRSTQFFEFASSIAQAGTIGEEVYISPAAFQPIAADEAVSALTDLVLGPPLNAIAEVAGPVRMPMYELIHYYLNAIEDSRQVVEDEEAPLLWCKIE